MALGDATIAYPVGSPQNPIGLLPQPIGVGGSGTDRTVQPVGTESGQDPLASLLASLGVGGLDLYNIISGKPASTASTAANISNPLLPLQPQARTDMSALMADPSSVLKDPGFQAYEALGAENISRFQGSKGMAGSGNRLADLFKFGQTSGPAYEQQRYNQLLGLLAPSPYAAQNYLGGQQGQQGSIMDLIKQLMGGAGGPGAIQQLLKLIGGGGGAMDTPDLGGAFGAGNTTGGIIGQSDFNFGDVSTGDQNIMNDIFSTPNTPDLSTLFGFGGP